MSGRVLLVESDEALRTNVVKALRARGIGVDAFERPTDVLRAIERGSAWSRALISLALEGMDGATLASHVLAHVPELEVTFLTGGVTAEVLCRAHALGNVIWKPVGLGPLCEVLATTPRRSGVIRKASAPAAEPARPHAVKR
jgi:DNA-binding NtrC family response regulator